MPWRNQMAASRREAELISVGARDGVGGASLLLLFYLHPYYYYYCFAPRSPMTQGKHAVVPSGELILPTGVVADNFSPTLT